MTFKCDKCNNSFLNKFNLDRHLKRKTPCDKKKILVYYVNFVI